MKEFQNQVKSAVKASAPNREAIRHAVKEGQFLVKTEPTKEESAVGSLFRTVGAIAAVFLAVIGIFVASVLVDQTKRPVGAGVGTVESSDTLDDDWIVDDTIYPLNYQTPDRLPLWEGRTSEEELANCLNHGDIIFADTAVPSKSDWSATDLENLTTTRLHQISGCELIADKQHFYLLEDKKLFTVAEIPDTSLYRNNQGNAEFVGAIPSYYLSVNVIPCQIGNDVGFILSYFDCSIIMQHDEKEVTEIFRNEILYYDCLTKTATPLLSGSDAFTMDDMGYYFVAEQTEDDGFLFGGHVLAITLQSVKDNIAQFRILSASGNTYGEKTKEIECVLLHNESFEYRCDLYYDTVEKTWTWEKQKQPPITEEPPVTQEPEVTISAWDDAHLLDLYPLNYRTAYERPLWEGRTSGEELAEKLNNGEIAFAPSVSNISYKDGAWEASDFRNITTKEMYDVCHAEILILGQDFFLLQDGNLYLMSEGYCMGYLMMDGYIPCQFGTSRGVILSREIYTPFSGLPNFVIHSITYYDIDSRTETLLFNSTTDLLYPYEMLDLSNVIFHGIGDQVVFSIPGDGYLALYKVSESEEGSHYQLISFFDVKREYRDVFDRETNQTSAILYITDVGAYYSVGDLYYNAEERVWSFVLNDEPAPDVPSTTQ